MGASRQDHPPVVEKIVGASNIHFRLRSLAARVGNCLEHRNGAMPKLTLAAVPKELFEEFVVVTVSRPPDTGHDRCQ